MRKRHIILLGILVLALCLRLYRLSWNILICDELSSILWWVDLSLIAKFIRSAIIDPTPPLYFIILHSWIKLFGGTEFSIRLLSVLMGLFSIIMLYLIGKELINIKAGLGGALLMALSPYHLFYSTYARTYALFLSLVLLSYYFFIKFIKEGHRKWLWFYILSSALSLYTHYSALYAILVQNVYFFIFWKDYRKLTFLWIKAMLGIILCFLPLLPIFLKDLFLSEWSLKMLPAIPLLERILVIKQVLIYSFMPYIGQTYFSFSIEDFYQWRLLKWIVHTPFLMHFINSLMQITFVIFFISGVVYLFKEKKRFVFISLYFFTIFVFFLLVPRYNQHRFFLQICPAFYLIVATGIMGWGKKAKALSLSLVLLFHLLPLNGYYAQIKMSPVKSAFVYLNASYKKEDIILINSHDVRNWGVNFWYHNRFQNNANFDIRLLISPARPKSTPLPLAPPGQGGLRLPKGAGMARNNAGGYKKIKRRFKPLLKKLKSASQYHNVEDIFETITLDDLDKKKRIWYVGDKRWTPFKNNEEVIALLESKSFNLATWKDFGGTRLYLLQKR